MVIITDSFNSWINDRTGPLADEPPYNLRKASAYVEGTDFQERVRTLPSWTWILQKDGTRIPCPDCEVTWEYWNEELLGIHSVKRCAKHSAKKYMADKRREYVKRITDTPDYDSKYWWKLVLTFGKPIETNQASSLRMQHLLMAEMRLKMRQLTQNSIWRKYIRSWFYVYECRISEKDGMINIHPHVHILVEYHKNYTLRNGLLRPLDWFSKRDTKGQKTLKKNNFMELKSIIELFCEGHPQFAPYQELKGQKQFVSYFLKYMEKDYKNPSFKGRYAAFGGDWYGKAYQQRLAGHTDAP